MALVVSFLLGGFTVAGAQNAGSAAAKPTNWSDPASWPNNKVPVAGDKVTIGRDRNVILDVSPPALAGLSIDGKLSFSNDADLELTTEWIMLHGELVIGSEGSPHTRNATITRRTCNSATETGWHSISRLTRRGAPPSTTPTACCRSRNEC